jgi:hypothetical protein
MGRVTLNKDSGRVTLNKGLGRVTLKYGGHVKNKSHNDLQGGIT